MLFFYFSSYFCTKYFFCLFCPQTVQDICLPFRGGAHAVGGEVLPVVISLLQSFACLHTARFESFFFSYMEGFVFPFAAMRQVKILLLFVLCSCRVALASHSGEVHTQWAERFYSLKFWNSCLFCCLPLCGKFEIFFQFVCAHAPWPLPPI